MGIGCRAGHIMRFSTHPLLIKNMLFLKREGKIEDLIFKNTTRKELPKGNFSAK